MYIFWNPSTHGQQKGRATGAKNSLRATQLLCAAAPISNVHATESHPGGKRWPLHIGFSRLGSGEYRQCCTTTLETRTYSGIVDIPDSEFRSPEWTESATSMQEYPNSEISSVGNSGFAMMQSRNFRNRLRQIPKIPGCGLEWDAHSV